jgi:hypothetical protein
MVAATAQIARPGALANAASPDFSRSSGAFFIWSSPTFTTRRMGFSVRNE